MAQIAKENIDHVIDPLANAHNADLVTSQLLYAI